MMLHQERCWTRNKLGQRVGKRATGIGLPFDHDSMQCICCHAHLSEVPETKLDSSERNSIRSSSPRHYVQTTQPSRSCLMPDFLPSCQSIGIAVLTPVHLRRSACMWSPSRTPFWPISKPRALEMVIGDLHNVPPLLVKVTESGWKKQNAFDLVWSRSATMIQLLPLEP